MGEDRVTVMTVHTGPTAQPMFQRVKGFLEEACMYSDGVYQVEDFACMIYEQKMDLWVIHDEDNPFDVLGTFVTRMMKYVDHTAMVIVAAGGAESRAWLPHLQELEGYAMAHGAIKLRFGGRKGWAKLLKPCGFQEKSVFMSKDLVRMH